MLKITKENNMGNLITYIGQVKELIAAIVAIILFIIVSWKQIQAELNRAADLAKRDLSNIVTGLISKAETKPVEILNSLTDTTRNKFPAAIPSEASAPLKQALVLEAIKERNPELLKMAKLKDVPAILGFISNVYQGVKPVIGLLRKKK